MKRILLPVFLLLFPAVSFSQPSIVFDSEKYNFGSVSEYMLEHTFNFTNAGDEELIIERVVPS